jgi:hypothetical protein
MPVIIGPGFAQVRVLFQQSQTGLHLSNSYGVDLDDTVGQGDVDTLSTALAAAYKPILASGSLYNGLHVVIGSDGDHPVFDSVSGAGVGSRTISAPATPQVQLLCDKVTAFGGRKFRGRTFLPDVAEADVGGNGALQATPLSLLATFTAAVVVALNVTPWNGMVILHQDATTPTPVTAFSADPFCGTLRRRYPR